MYLRARPWASRPIGRAGRQFSTVVSAPCCRCWRLAGRPGTATAARCSYRCCSPRLLAASAGLMGWSSPCRCTSSSSPLASAAAIAYMAWLTPTRHVGRDHQVGQAIQGIAGVRPVRRGAAAYPPPLPAICWRIEACLRLDGGGLVQVAGCASSRPISRPRRASRRQARRADRDGANVMGSDEVRATPLFRSDQFWGRCAEISDEVMGRTPPASDRAPGGIRLCPIFSGATNLGFRPVFSFHKSYALSGLRDSAAVTARAPRWAVRHFPRSRRPMRTRRASACRVAACFSGRSCTHDQSPSCSTAAGGPTSWPSTPPPRNSAPPKP